MKEQQQQQLFQHFNKLKNEVVQLLLARHSAHMEPFELATNQTHQLYLVCVCVCLHSPTPTGYRTVLIMPHVFGREGPYFKDLYTVTTHTHTASGLLVSGLVFAEKNFSRKRSDWANLLWTPTHVATYME